MSMIQRNKRKQRTGFGFFLLIVGLGLYLVYASAGNTLGFASEGAAAQVKAQQNPLPLPGTMTVEAFEKKLYPFILDRKYASELNWHLDKTVRDTGPYIKKKYYGTHPAVRIFYSPRVMYWLTGNPDYWKEGKASGKAKRKKPREGAIPDGGMIVKEMFTPPAARYEGLSDKQITAALLKQADTNGWTVMVKDASASKDGWFWSSVFAGEAYDTPDSFNYPDSGFGSACIRCHASAEKESTFSALRNIKGFPGDPITFFVDDSWRDLPREEQPFSNEHALSRDKAPVTHPIVAPNPEFLETFNSIDNVPYQDVLQFPSEVNDHVYSGPNGPGQFLTSDQCLMCHSGANAKFSFGPDMFLQMSPESGLNVSPYGEWRWSPMGLAGRDPIFHAQLESELSILKNDMPKDPEKAEFFGQQTVNTCLLCHGVMGKHQYDIDKGVGDKYWVEEANFKLEWYYIKDPENKHYKYGGLGRDGISCLACHHQVEEYKSITNFLENSITGQFKMGKADEVYGPFRDNEVSPLPMENFLGITPKYNPYIQSSRMCGSCHTIDLPVVDYPLANPPELPVKVTPDPVLNKPDKNPNFKPFMHKIEQATYLEWLNSKYQNEFKPWAKDAQSCQDCHMPGGYESLDGKINIEQLKTKIATVEDQDYPEADHRAATEDIRVRFREEGYRRHRLQGLNIFLAHIFKQFNTILGVRLQDYETGSFGLNFAIDNFVENARKNSADLEIIDFKTTSQELTATVKVTNKTGHRLPSGVGFRRLFIEFLVLDNSTDRPRVVWSSGLTNGVGVIVDGDGKVLPSEFFTPYMKDGQKHQDYQPHWEVIDSQDKVQIYEELSKNAKAEFTTSFIHRDYEQKDNRLLPMGWTKEGPSKKIPHAFIEATYPGPRAKNDRRYGDGSGTDEVTYRVKMPKGVNWEKVSVRATLYSQAWAPYYLNQRFTDVPVGPGGDARRRLYYLTSHLKVKGTAIEDWKFKLVSDSAPKVEVEK
ncbi:MAG: cytochrome P460 family protein [bacterium]|nr:cytochrome P460 family protein [bacterium]